MHDATRWSVITGADNRRKATNDRAAAMLPRRIKHIQWSFVAGKSVDELQLPVRPGISTRSIAGFLIQWCRDKRIFTMERLSTHI